MMLAESEEREGSLLFSLVSVTVSFPSLLYRQSNTMFWTCSQQIGARGKSLLFLVSMKQITNLWWKCSHNMH